jgi:serine/threonine protein phosphatase 1
MIPVYQENTRGRDFVIGDLHGCIDALHRKMDKKNFDQSVDRIFATGDLVDRGPQSEKCLDLLDEPWFVSVMGNHEDAGLMFATGNLRDMNWYVGIGGAWLVGKTPPERAECAIKFASMPLAIEVEIGGGRTVGIVHAECPFDHWDAFRQSQLPLLPSWKSIAEQNAILGAAMWTRTKHARLDDSVIHGIHAVVVGHTPVERITSLGNTFYIDTHCYKTGKLAMKELKNLVGS